MIAPNIAQINHVHFSRTTVGLETMSLGATMALRSGYDGWCGSALGRAPPDLAAATRVWRDFFPTAMRFTSSEANSSEGEWAKPDPGFSTRKDKST